MLSPIQISAFQQKVWDFYRTSGRPFPWRYVDDPYRVMVSEVMLQQTQTNRVEPKYELFLSEFPTIVSLANAELCDVLCIWQGLGYNRRARYLREAARGIVEEHGAQVPSDVEALQRLPGIGHATAAAICAYAFNKPVVFIETNIRTVFIHTFFDDLNQVHDRDIIPLVEATLERDTPREWYYALTDYGVMLKARHANPSRRSRHYIKQSKFEGSDRQIRGEILRILALRGSVCQEELVGLLNQPCDRLERIFDGLVADCMIVQKGGQISIP